MVKDKLSFKYLIKYLSGFVFSTLISAPVLAESCHDMFPGKDLEGIADGGSSVGIIWSSGKNGKSYFLSCDYDRSQTAARKKITCGEINTPEYQTFLLGLNFEPCRGYGSSNYDSYSCLYGVPDHILDKSSGRQWGLVYDGSHKFKYEHDYDVAQKRQVETYCFPLDSTIENPYYVSTKVGHLIKKDLTTLDIYNHRVPSNPFNYEWLEHNKQVKAYPQKFQQVNIWFSYLDVQIPSDYWGVSGPPQLIYIQFDKTLYVENVPNI
tara:strand:+ start:411 stop:1205 length:795 start_codon:yes stop_codon:yes gene_type:complete